jgi:hypothetical protein
VARIPTEPAPGIFRSIRILYLQTGTYEHDCPATFMPPARRVRRTDRAVYLSCSLTQWPVSGIAPKHLHTSRGSSLSIKRSLESSLFRIVRRTSHPCERGPSSHFVGVTVRQQRCPIRIPRGWMEGRLCRSSTVDNKIESPWTGLYIQIPTATGIMGDRYSRASDNVDPDWPSLDSSGLFRAMGLRVAIVAIGRHHVELW